jgi:hypothetical protein
MAKKKVETQSIAVGLDVGTMNLVSAKLENNAVSCSSLRNMYLKVPKGMEDQLDLGSISYVQIDEDIYILSDEAFAFANIFNIPAKRPMKRGMVSSDELDATDVLAAMVKELVGIPGENARCCFSIPATPIDSPDKTTFHKGVFDRILSTIGFKPSSITEGVAVVYSECQPYGFTGIGISFGAGMTNIGVTFKSVPVLTFSLSRGGDWVDENAANATGTIANRITAIKEKADYAIGDFSVGDRKEKRIREALGYYYRELIAYTTRNISEKLAAIDTDFPDQIPIIVSGGTSRAKGFIDFFKEAVSGAELPFTVKEIKCAENPMTAVAEGCLVSALKG